jgi:hypothetical protein
VDYAEQRRNLHFVAFAWPLLHEVEQGHRSLYSFLAMEP